LSAPLLSSCSLQWEKPKTHFDGVNEFGHVSYWEQVGALRMEDGVTIPLIAGFRSDWKHTSPYLGYGWLLGIFDSYFIQTGPDTFDMIQPDGYTVPFGRDSKTPTILHGAKQWKAVIKGDTLTAYAACGWTLVFVKGRIASIGTPKNRTLTIRRDSEGVATEIVEGATSLLKVERDVQNAVAGLRLGDIRVGLERTDKPRIQSLAGRNVIAGMDWAVGAIQLSDGQKSAFDYSAGDQLTPALAIRRPSTAYRQIRWDAATGLILSDGPWTYAITPAAVAGHNAEIRRTNSQGQKELWHVDQAKGRMMATFSDGSSLTETHFVSGLLTGKPREFVQQNPDGSFRRTKWRYNAEAQPLERQIISQRGSAKQTETICSFEYEPDGSRTERLAINQAESVRTYDKEGRLVREKTLDGSEVLIAYLPDGRHQRKLITPSGDVYTSTNE